MTVGENIKRIRKEKGLTQKKLGELCGINEVQIRRYELGGKNSNPKIETLRKIADALEVKLFQLTDGDYSSFSAEEMRDDFLKSATPLDEFHKKLVANAKEEENNLLGNYRQLNTEGRQEAQKRVQELTEIKRYTETEEPPAE